MNIKTVRQTITFKAPPHDVYEALMDSKILVLRPYESRNSRKWVRNHSGRETNQVYAPSVEHVVSLSTLRRSAASTLQMQ